MKLKNFFTSGWEIEEFGIDLKSRFQMLNIGIITSSASLIYGIIRNFLMGKTELIGVEMTLLSANIILFFILRKNKKYLEYAMFYMTAQFTIFFLLLVYVSEPDELKHIWLFTYSIILLYFQGQKRGFYWFSFLIIMLFIAPIQPFIDVKYTLQQITYIIFALLIVNAIIHFYQQKMTQAKELIIVQQDKLQEKIDELTKKDEILTAQSKQAVMGEMISMIAHQWRQPLSTITLQISNMQIKRLLNGNFTERDSDRVMNEISETIIYLSNTIDDFQTYFHPDK